MEGKKEDNMEICQKCSVIAKFLNFLLSVRRGGGRDNFFVNSIFLLWDLKGRPVTDIPVISTEV